jgi:hypothetical protein
MRHLFTLVLGLFVGLLLFESCKSDEGFITDGSAKLEFSLDTLRFDTVFTELGSATRFIRVYNRNDQAIQISNIQLEEGESSAFRINVDGIPGDVAENVEIAANDSIYIFAEVTVNPDAPLSESPFVITENLLFETNGNDQRVVLEAWGQNANYIPSKFGKGTVSLLSCDFGDVTWDDPKPYVIYGILVIDSCTLNIPSGAEVYIHGGLALGQDEEENVFAYNDGAIFVYPDGRINVEGTVDEPVVFQGDRLEEVFAEEPGQWAGIRLYSPDNNIKYAEIKNSLYGVLVDSSALLNISNSSIHHTSGPAIYARHSSVVAENNLFYANASRSIQLTYGGSYFFKYCTMANYGFGFDSRALSLANGSCLDPLCTEAVVNPIFARFDNCIIAGSSSDEISMSDFIQDGNIFNFNVRFENCVVRVEDILDPEDGAFPNFFDDYTKDCINVSSSDVLFADASENDYHLDTLSVAEEAAKVILSIQKDFADKDRDSTNPDIGCFEYQYE